jgi:maleylacetoacetate isomerase
MKLYGYYRSSAAYRMRIALNLKGIDCEQQFVHLRKGEHLQPGYLELNPQGKVPALLDGDTVVTQSMAIAEYLEETRGGMKLLPDNAADRSRIRSLCQAIACDIHPLNNLSVLNYLVNDMGLSEDQKNRWYHHWIASGLRGIEAMLAESPQTGTYCHGDEVTLADVFLVPQIYNAGRFDCDLTPYPTVMRINDSCNELDAFIAAHPDNQPDNE